MLFWDSGAVDLVEAGTWAHTDSFPPNLVLMCMGVASLGKGVTLPLCRAALGDAQAAYSGPPTEQTKSHELVVKLASTWLATFWATLLAALLHDTRVAAIGFLRGPTPLETGLQARRTCMPICRDSARGRYGRPASCGLGGDCIAGSWG